ncbi:histidine phosphatase family protein [Ureibacillus aquaedulcis]|uniref:Histidine phosphatase family protein n=1 Tax=Ureibacillus aquaedulcis TaxID=3058421 RepID=A0ABT8GPM8_9BACL|nr:histidine phosphatase family protein [Ureibacillus sp. BA0131]MDN4493261.1 histidine phosphatase family protein [Ureibacillus sp. BA0131]
MGNPAVVHLIRHEKTDANLKRKYIGWTDEPIDIKEQYFNITINPGVVYGSDLKRCIETAHLYFPQATYLPDRNLRELNFGDFEMKTYEELRNLSLYRRWIDDPKTTTPPNGESYDDFEQRVLRSFFHIVSQNDESTFVVHGGVIRVLLFLFGPVENTFQQIMISHRTIYSLQWPDYSELKEGKRCKLLSEEPIMAKENL